MNSPCKFCGKVTPPDLVHHCGANAMRVTENNHKRVRMKKLVEVTEVENEGLMALLGKKVTFFCLNYIYHGELIGVNDSCVLIKNPSIVYETGKFSDSQFKDIQSLCVDEFYISMNCIESFGELSK